MLNEAQDCSVSLVRASRVRERSGAAGYSLLEQNMIYLSLFFFFSLLFPRENLPVDGAFLLPAGSFLCEEQHPHHRLRLRAPAHHLVLLLL